MSVLDLLKRSEKGSGLTNAEEDANKTAIETFINAILAGTAGYQAGDALKLGGVLASLFFNDNNCPSNVGAGWVKLKNGLIIQRGSQVWTNVPASIQSISTIPLPQAYTTAGVFLGSAWPAGSWTGVSVQSSVIIGTTQGQIAVINGPSIQSFTIGWMSIGY